MTKLELQRLGWRFAILGTLSLALVFFCSERQVLAAGECIQCDSNLFNCESDCNSLPPAQQPACQNTCSSTWNGCINNSCWGLNPGGFQHTACQIRANSAEAACLDGSHIFYPTSYNCCIASGYSVDDCCALIADMRWDSCCKTSYCP